MPCLGGGFCLGLLVVFCLRPFPVPKVCLGLFVLPWRIFGCLFVGGSWVVFVPTVVVAGLNVELWAFYFDYKNNSGPELVGVIILNFVGETVFPRPRAGGFELNLILLFFALELGSTGT